MNYYAFLFLSCWPKSSTCPLQGILSSEQIDNQLNWGCEQDQRQYLHLLHYVHKLGEEVEFFYVLPPNPLPSAIVSALDAVASHTLTPERCYVLIEDFYKIDHQATFQLLSLFMQARVNISFVVQDFIGVFGRISTILGSDICQPARSASAQVGSNSSRKLEVKSDELRVTSENAREVGESLAPARLCRGEACLARDNRQ